MHSCVTRVDGVSENQWLINKSNPDYEMVFAGRQFDLVINAAGSMSVQFSIENLKEDFHYNVVNTFHILDCIRKYSPDSKFINLSSAAVYGNPQVIPIQEVTSQNPISPYGFHKEFAEKICSEFSQLFHIKCLSLRIFSVYGPGLKKQILWDINKKIQESKDSSIELFGSGNESRDFIYIDDLVNAIQLVALKGDFHGDVYNVGNGQEITIKEMATLFVHEMNPSIKLNFIGKTRAGDPMNWQADITKLKMLGYKPLTSLETGLKNYAQWLKK